MALLNNENAMKSAATTAFSVDYSCRFDGAEFLKRTPSSNANLQTWTLAAWVKRAEIDSGQIIFGAERTSGTEGFFLYFTNTNEISCYQWNGSGYDWQLTESAQRRDTGAWMHISMVVEMSSAQSDRIKLFFNGERITAFSTSTLPSSALDTQWGASGKDHWIGVFKDESQNFYDGYLADLHFVEGSALAPDGNFIEKNDDGLWVPKEYTGSHGDEGYHLDFASAGTTSGSNTGLGKDVSGNENYFTTTNLGSEDQVIDTPAAGKNYCTLNPLDTSSDLTLREGILKLEQTNATAAYDTSRSTFAVQSIDGGKSYFEFYMESHPSTQGYQMLGLATANTGLNSYAGGANNEGYSLQFATGSTSAFLYPHTTTYITLNAVQSSSGSVNAGDFLVMAVDATSRTAVKIWMGFDEGNGVTWLPSSSGGTEGDPSAGTNPTFTTSSDVGDLFPSMTFFSPSGSTGSMKGVFNFGQDATFAGNKSPSTTYADSGGTGEFFYEPPSGFKALCTENLPAVTLNNAKASEQAFEVITYEGTETEHTIPHSGTSPTSMSFNPDLIWVKNRSNTTGYHHGIADTVRGISSSLTPILSSSFAQQPEDNTTAQIEGVSSNQITLGNNDDSKHYVNRVNDDYVAWVWKEGATQGFDIVTYTGSSDTKTVNHSLGEAPELMFVKALDDGPQGEGSSINWAVYHKDVGAGGYLMLDSANDSASDTTIWDNTAPNDTAFTVGYNSGGLDLSYGGDGWSSFGTDYIAYLFRSIEGYSKVGIYTGNGLDNGPFVHLGFRPAFILIKNIDGNTGWLMFDSTRSPHNAVGEYLIADSSADEDDFDRIDFVSNGFKLRENYTGDNSSSTDYVFYAVAENPFKHANAR